MFSPMPDDIAEMMRKKRDSDDVLNGDLNGWQIAAATATAVVGTLVFPVGGGAALGLTTANAMRITNLEGRLT